MNTKLLIGLGVALGLLLLLLVVPTEKSQQPVPDDESELVEGEGTVQCDRRLLLRKDFGAPVVGSGGAVGHFGSLWDCTADRRAWQPEFASGLVGLVHEPGPFS